MGNSKTLTNGGSFLYICGMKKLLSYYLLLRWTKDSVVAAKIYQMLYTGEKIDFSTNVSSVSPTTPAQPQTKKQELETSLSYLKSKPVKSAKDKESIQMIQAVLKNLN